MDDWRKSHKKESHHIVNLVESIGFFPGRLKSGEKVAIRFISGLRHEGTGYDHFVIVSPETAKAWPESPYAKHKWTLRKAKSGDYEVRLYPTKESPNNKTQLASRAIYELAHGPLPNTRHRVAIKPQGDRRGGLDLRLCNLGVEAPADYRPRVTTCKPPPLDDLRDDINDLLPGNSD